MSERPWATWYSHRRWRRIRARQLAKEPLCRRCRELGRITPAEHVDHIEPHKGDRAKFWGGPFQSLCASHHSEKTALEEGKQVRPEVADDGTPDGW